VELGPLRSFLVLARERNVTRAAEVLHLTQPAVSNQLARLERELGRLFDRTSKGLLLTPAGRLFHGYVEQALGRLDDGEAALAELAGLERGSLAVGGGATATTYLLPSLLGRFHAEHPAIRLFVREQGSQSVVEAVLSGELDLGVVTLPVETHAGGGARLEVGRLEIERWLEDELLLIVPPGHALAKRRRYRWRDLDGQPVVLFEAGTAVRALIDRRLASAGIDVEIVMELRSIESIKQMVAQGIGAAFVSSFALGPQQRGLRCSEGRLARELALVYRADRTLSESARAFLELLRQVEPAGVQAGAVSGAG
jgi:LysR family cyn operon transcriptional activator